MTPPRARPLVLVHGAWHQPSIWDQLVACLPEDVDVLRVDLPSSDMDRERLGDGTTDIDAIRAGIRELVRRHPGQPVTVVAHSYAGIPVSQALTTQDSTSVGRVVYVGAALLGVGESLLKAAGGAPPPWWKISSDRRVVDVINPEAVFYHDVLDPALVEAALSALRHQSYASLTRPVASAPAPDIPSTYIVLDDDHAFPPAAQQVMASGTSRIRHLHTSHSPFLSAPQALASLVLEPGTVAETA